MHPDRHRDQDDEPAKQVPSSHARVPIRRATTKRSQCFLPIEQCASRAAQVYGEVMSEQQYRIGVLAGAAVLVAVITYLRFCGSVGLPPKPPPPTGPRGTQTQLLSQSAAS